MCRLTSLCTATAAAAATTRGTLLLQCSSIHWSWYAQRRRPSLELIHSPSILAPRKRCHRSMVGLGLILYLPPTMSIYRLLYIGPQFKKWSFVSVSESFHPKWSPIRTVSFLLMRFRLFLSIWIRKWAKFFCGHCYRFDTIGHGWPGGLMA